MTYSELFLAIKDYLQNDFPLNTWTSISGTGVITSDGTEQINMFIKQAEDRIYNTVQIPALRKNVTGVIAQGNQYVSCPIDFLSVFSIAVIDGNGSYTYLLNKDVNFLREVYPNPNTTGIPKYYALFGPTVSVGTISDELSLILAPTPNNFYDVELHYYYYPESIIQSPVVSIGTITGGSSYTNGTYYNTKLTGGKGTGATANITVSGGSVISVTITNGGTNYVIGDLLSATLPNGTGFNVPVLNVGNINGRTWLGDNYSPVLLYGSLLEGYTFLKGEVEVMTFYEKKYQEALGQLNRLGTGLERGDAYRDGQAKIKVFP